MIEKSSSKPRIFGLTGGSGAGKTLASISFRKLGAGIVDADAVYRELCTRNSPMLSALTQAFGDVLTPTNELDRKKLANIVFSDAQKLELLNQVTVPFIRAASVKAFDALYQSGHDVVLYDAPTLFQTGADTLCEGVIGVVAVRETRLQRIISRDRLTQYAAAARIDAQPDAEFYRQRCQYIIENDGLPESLTEQVKIIWQKITEHKKPYDTK